MLKEALMKAATECGCYSMKNKFRMRITALLFLLCLFFNSKCQMALHKRVKTQLYDKGFNIMPAYKLRGDTLEAYTDAYAGQPLEKFRIIFPVMTGCTDTGYAFIYFGGFERAVCKDYSVIIIGNAQSYKTPKLFIDHNHNLDYRDDGPPVEFPYSQERIEFDLCNQAVPSGCLHYVLSRYRIQNQYDLRRNLNQFFESNAGTKKYLGLENSFRIQWQNQWGEDFTIGADSFRVVVEDHNMNGIYNEPGVDHIQLVPYGQEPVSNNINEGSIIIPKGNKPVVLQHLNESYSVSNISADGRSINLVYSGKHKRPAEKLINRRAPRFKFEILSYRKYNKLRKYKGTPVFLYFYNFKTADTIVFNQLKKLYEASQGKLTIITLNYGDNPQQVKDFVMQNYYMWTNGLATRRIIRQYKVDQLPMGFYLDHRLRVRQIGITPMGMLKFLQSN
jgi:hypothetical protein